MTPPAAISTTAPPDARPPRGRAAARPAARGSRPPAPGRAPSGAGVGTAVTAAGALHVPPLGLRVARSIATLPDARLLDRLLRGRLWIALLTVALVGIVFLQISLLKLNTGIARAVQTTQTLERQNTALKFDLSRLGGGERVQDSAAAMGFVAPAVNRPRFLDAGKASAERAAANIAAPAPIQQLPLGMIPAAQGGTAGVTPDPVAAAAGSSAPGAEPPPTAPAVGAPGSATAPGAAVPAPAPPAVPAGAAARAEAPSSPTATSAPAAAGRATSTSTGAAVIPPPSGGATAGPGG